MDSEAQIKLQEQQLVMLQEENHQLRQVLQASQQAGAATANYSPEATPTIPPCLFNGTLGTCRGYLLQCMHTFDLRPSMIEKHRILYIVGLVWGRAPVSVAERL